MSATPSSTPPDAKPKEAKEKPTRKRTKKKSKRHSRKNILKTKVVVRRLPPNLPEDIFMNSVKPWISEDTVNYSLYVPGKLSKSKAKESIFSRAYFHMKTMEAVVAFHQGFDGHVFMDSRGNESRAVVEFAPYQKIPKEHKSVDVRQGTIDEDQDYLDFLESLKQEEKKQSEVVNEPADGLTQIERLENRIAMVTAKTLAAEQANKPKTTPLLEHLRAQKAAQAAAKAKATAKKNARRRGEKSTVKNTTEQAPKVIQQQTQPTEIKKKRERNRKKKDVDPTKKPVETSSPTTASSSTTTTKPRPPREPRDPKTRDARPPRPPKEGGNSKPKRSKKPATGESNETKPKPVKVLGRQPASRPSPSG